MKLHAPNLLRPNPSESPTMLGPARKPRLRPRPALRPRRNPRAPVLAQGTHHESRGPSPQAATPCPTVWQRNSINGKKRHSRELSVLTASLPTICDPDAVQLGALCSCAASIPPGKRLKNEMSKLSPNELSRRIMIHEKQKGPGFVQDFPLSKIRIIMSLYCKIIGLTFLSHQARLQLVPSKKHISSAFSLDCDVAGESKLDLISKQLAPIDKPQEHQLEHSLLPRLRRCPASLSLSSIRRLTPIACPSSSLPC